MRLDDSARMNTPGRAEGNWTWRVGEAWVWEHLADESAELRRMIEQCDRLAPAARGGKSGGGKSGGASFQ